MWLQGKRAIEKRKGGGSPAAEPFSVPRFLMLPAVLLLMSAPAFAADGFNYLEVGFLASVYQEERGNVFSPGGVAAWSYDPLFTIRGDDVGVGVWLGFGFPVLRNGYVGQIVHAMAGPVFTVWHNERLTIPVGLGCYVNSATLLDEAVLGVGVGANIAFQWRFAPHEYLYGRFQGAWTFHGRGELVIAPSIGVGFALGRKYETKKADDGPGITPGSSLDN